MGLIVPKFDDLDAIRYYFSRGICFRHSRGRFRPFSDQNFANIFSDPGVPKRDHDFPSKKLGLGQDFKRSIKDFGVSQKVTGFLRYAWGVFRSLGGKMGAADVEKNLKRFQ